MRTPIAKAIKKAARVSRGELWHGTFSPWVGGRDTEIARRGGPLFESCYETTTLKRQNRTVTGDNWLRIGMRSDEASVDGSADLTA